MKEGREFDKWQSGIGWGNRQVEEEGHNPKDGGDEKAQKEKQQADDQVAVIIFDLGLGLILLHPE